LRFFSAPRLANAAIALTRAWRTIRVKPTQQTTGMAKKRSGSQHLQ
jgi:hypothetical protein